MFDIKNKCIFCQRSNVSLHFFGQAHVCHDCVSVANRLLNEEHLSPSNAIDEALMTLIFFLETDLILTRHYLNHCRDNGELQRIICIKKQRINMIHETKPYHDGSSVLVLKVNELVKQHQLLLSLYCT